MQFVVALVLAVIVFVIMLVRDEGYRRAVLDWFSFRDPLGTRLWTKYPAQHLAPIIVAAIWVVLSLVFFP
jgi:hypothetical protein